MEFRDLGRRSQKELIETYRMIGESETFLDCMQKVSEVAKINRPVLIIGERGTGKELVAARLHYLSSRWKEKRITINCAAFQPNLLESEIFGYERGAFTGASTTKPGRFELADRGTLFLDELAQSPMALQEKILRVLEYGEFERVGGTQSIRVDVRVVAATNVDLPEYCRQGKFKMDLLDRLSFEVITLPPLRERKDDIALLTRYFSLKMARELNYTEPPLFTEEAMHKLLNHAWPGNIRELKNVVERAVYRNHGEPIEDIILDPFDSPFRLIQKKELEQKIKEESKPKQQPIEVKRIPSIIPEAGFQNEIEKLEKEMLQEAMERAHFNQKKAAELLQLNYYQFRRYLKKYDLP